MERPRLALAIITTSSLMLIVDATVMNVALPRIAETLDFSPTGLSWVLTAYTLSFGGLLLLGGRAGDILGRRRVFVFGVALFTAASLLGGLAPGAGWLLAARVAQGIGAAAAGPNTIALVSTTFTDPRQRLRALALLSAVNSAGFAIGLIVGGALTAVASWRWVLFINVPFGVAAVLLAPRFVKEPPRNPSKVDIPGALTASLGVAAVVYGLIHAASDGWSSRVTVLALALGIGLLAGFVAFEARATAPQMPLRLFADRNRAAAYLSFLLGPAAMMSMFFFLTQFMQDIRGYGALATGFAFLPLAAGMFTSARVVPALLPRFGPRPLALTGSALMVTGLVWLTRLTPDSGYAAGLLPAMALLGLGGGLAFVPLTPLIMTSVEPADAGAAGGVLQTLQQLGATLGLAALVTVFGTSLRGAPDPGTPDAMVTAMAAAFTLSAVIAAASALVALTFRRPDPGGWSPVGSGRMGRAEKEGPRHGWQRRRRLGVTLRGRGHSDRGEAATR
jgi:EmrB/QacA subfamily drug resistance transporter